GLQPVRLGPLPGPAQRGRTGAGRDRGRARRDGAPGGARLPRARAGALHDSQGRARGARGRERRGGRPRALRGGRTADRRGLPTRALAGASDALGDPHPLAPEDVRQVEGRVDLEVDLLPVRHHLPDVLVALGLEDDHVGRLAAERAPEANRPQARRLLSLVPPLARLGGQVDVAELPARLVLHERDEEHGRPSLRSLWTCTRASVRGWTRLAGSGSMGAWLRSPSCTAISSRRRPSRTSPRWAPTARRR